jgi:hypothetical protein
MEDFLVSAIGSCLRHLGCSLAVDAFRRLEPRLSRRMPQNDNTSAKAIIGKVIVSNLACAMILSLNLSRKQLSRTRVERVAGCSRLEVWSYMPIGVSTKAQRSLWSHGSRN